LLGCVFAGQQSVVALVHDPLGVDAGADQQSARRIVIVAKPCRTRSARTQAMNRATLIGGEPIWSLSTAQTENLADAGLPPQQRFTPWSGGQYIRGAQKLRMQLADQRRQQHHIAESAEAHNERPRRLLIGYRRHGRLTAGRRGRLMRGYI
jgi:hypothetical protein